MPNNLPEGGALEGVDMPKPSVPPGTAEIYKEIWLWLKQRGCENLVNNRLIDSFAQVVARRIQCEDAVPGQPVFARSRTDCLCSPSKRRILVFGFTQTFFSGGQQ